MVECAERSQVAKDSRNMKTRKTRSEDRFLEQLKRHDAFCRAQREAIEKRLEDEDRVYPLRDRIIMSDSVRKTFEEASQ